MNNIFQARKGIHIELDRETHAGLRAKLFPLGLSMQQVFEEFARRFVADDNRAMHIIDTIIERRIREAAKGSKHDNPQTRIVNTSELDADVLYKLIDERLDSNDETDR